MATSNSTRIYTPLTDATVRCAEAAPQTPPGAAAQVWRAADAGAGCGIAGAPQRPDPLRQAGSRALSHLPGCRAVPARAGGAGGVGGTGASRPARQTAPADPMGIWLATFAPGE